MRGEGVDAGADEQEWIVGKDRYKFDAIFENLEPTDGKITGAGKGIHYQLSFVIFHHIFYYPILVMLISYVLFQFYFFFFY